MKLEPIRQAKLPKYAAALGILAGAALLTGCGPRIDGDVANPQVDSQEILELAGEETIAPDWTEPSGTTTGTAPEETCTTACPLSVEGTTDVPDDAAEPLMLEGDVAWIPDYQTAVDAINTACAEDAGAYEAAFAESGYALQRDESSFSHYGTRFTAVLRHPESGTCIAFFDGAAEDQGKSMREWMQGVCTASYDWGCVLEYPADANGLQRIIFIDRSRETDSIAADAEQIYKDVIE